ncbi:MAG: hypothetical protein D4R96_03360 [Nitrosopumilaceae archaeon]|nr:MAG: hypothetical protein D4R96_03360 [Nitrosopumilaceae archaeon]
MTDTCKINGQIEEIDRLIRERANDLNKLRARLEGLSRQRHDLLNNGSAYSIISSLRHRLYDIRLDESTSTGRRLAFRFSPVNHDKLHREDMDAIKSEGYEIDTLGDNYLWLDKIE